MFKLSLAKKSDEELMQLVAEGEGNALTELYNRYSAKLVRYFFRMLWKDEAKAQDFLHDLFLKLIRKPESFDRTRKFSTWLYSVAHNMCKNEYRRQAFRKRADDSLSQDLILISESSVEKEFRQLLNDALNRLEEDDRHLYALRFEVEMSMEDIAQLLECPVGTVKSRLFNLKKKLAGQLNADFPQTIKYGVQ
jgi:RNA polymerase sigma-70 factor, ECF subfamily